MAWSFREWRHRRWTARTLFWGGICSACWSFGSTARVNGWTCVARESKRERGEADRYPSRADDDEDLVSPLQPPVPERKAHAERNGRRNGIAVLSVRREVVGVRKATPPSAVLGGPLARLIAGPEVVTLRPAGVRAF